MNVCFVIHHIAQYVFIGYVCNKYHTLNWCKTCHAPLLTSAESVSAPTLHFL